MLHHTTPAPASPQGAARVPIRSQRPAHWAWFDHALIDDHAQHLGPIGVALYVALARYANHHTGQCWPSLVRLSRQLGITRLTARRYLQRLAAEGLIALQERPGQTFLVTLLEMPQPSQTCLPSKQAQEATCISGKQGDAHAVNTGCIPGKHEPEILNQHKRTRLGHRVREQGAAGSDVSMETQALASPSVPTDWDLADAFARLPASMQEELYTAATARLRAQGVQPAFCIRPVVLAEVFRGLQDAPGSTPPDAPPPCPQAAAAPPAPPPLHDVTPADLRDMGRVLALGVQARARGWLTGSEADQLHVVAAAVHARRVGHEPGALFVALLRDRRWEVLTQKDEDTARGWLRDSCYGPALRGGLTRLGALWEAPVPWAESEDRAVDPDGEDDG